MRTRADDWFDPVKCEVVYGIKVLHNGQWARLSVDGYAYLARTKEEREAMRAKIRRYGEPCVGVGLDRGGWWERA